MYLFILFTHVYGWIQSFVGSETALMHAIRWRDAAIVDVLLRYRADCEEIDTTGKTALHKACILRESSLKNTSTALEIVQVLLKHKADLSAIDKVTNVLTVTIGAFAKTEMHLMVSCFFLFATYCIMVERKCAITFCLFVW